MDDRFPIGLLLGAFMFAAMGFSLLFPAKSDKPKEAHIRLSRTQVVMGVGLLALSALLLFSMFNLGILFLFGPILVVGFGLLAAVAKLLDRRSTRKSN